MFEGSHDPSPPTIVDAPKGERSLNFLDAKLSSITEGSPTWVMPRSGHGSRCGSSSPAAVLGRARSEHRGDLAASLFCNQELAGLVQEVFHLCGHVAVTRRRTDDDYVVIDRSPSLATGAAWSSLKFRASPLPRAPAGDALERDKRAGRIGAFGDRAPWPRYRRHWNIRKRFLVISTSLNIEPTSD